MTELDDILTPTLVRQIEAEQALVNGDPEPRLAMTSNNDPVTVFGAKVPVRRGWVRSARPFAGSPRGGPGSNWVPLRCPGRCRLRGHGLLDRLRTCRKCGRGCAG
jgi:hypothetical protein